MVRQNGHWKHASIAKFMEIIHLLQRVCNCSVEMLDIGGNAGVYSASIASYGIHVYTFEACPEMAALLETTKAINDLESMHIINAEFGNDTFPAVNYTRRLVIRMGVNASLDILEREQVSFIQMQASDTGWDYILSILMKRFAMAFWFDDFLTRNATLALELKPEYVGKEVGFLSEEVLA